MPQTVQNQSVNTSDSSKAPASDDAVGLPKTQSKDHSQTNRPPQNQWFVALVRHNTERKLADSLAKDGIESFVASQMRLKVTPNGHKKWVERVLLAGKLFINCSERQRLSIVAHPFIYRFMTNPTLSLTHGHKALAVISDEEIKTLRFMLGQKDFPVNFSEHHYVKGEKVKVVRGALRGLQAVVVSSNDDRREVGVMIDFLGCALVTIPATDIEPIQ